MVANAATNQILPIRPVKTGVIYIKNCSTHYAIVTTATDAASGFPASIPTASSAQQCNEVAVKINTLQVSMLGYKVIYSLEGTSSYCSFGIEDAGKIPFYLIIKGFRGEISCFIQQGPGASQTMVVADPPMNIIPPAK